MTEPFVPRAKMRKRKKKHEGQNWDQSDVIRELDEAKRRGRQYCRGCRKYMPWQKLRANWEWAGRDLQLVWYCECGSAVLVRDYDVKKPKKKKKKRRLDDKNG